jgi:hypothetical protein
MVVGETLSNCVAVAVTVTVADADLVVSATLVALTVNVPVVAGAVYTPELETVPPVAVQVTDVLLEPLTVAVNCCVPLVASEAEVGLIATDTAGAVAVTVTVADADLVLSARLVAFTVYVPPVLGAVYRPELETVPPVALHVTAVLPVPVTVETNCWVAPVCNEAVVGVSATATGTGALVTVTSAEAVFVLSATLVAVTV